MARAKIYANAAQRQEAYRQRVQEKLAGMVSSRGLVVPRKPSRPKRLEKVLQELEKLGQEYEDWREAMPDNLSESELASQLEETIGQLQEVVSALESIELPRGFGR